MDEILFQVKDDSQTHAQILSSRKNYSLQTTHQTKVFSMPPKATSKNWLCNILWLCFRKYENKTVKVCLRNIRNQYIKSS